MSKITFLKSFDGNFEETAQFNTISKIVDMIFLYIYSFFLLVLVVIFRALCDAFSSREKKSTIQTKKVNLIFGLSLNLPKIFFSFWVILISAVVQNQLCMYTPRSNWALGSIQWTNTFGPKILKYIIKIIQNATLPNT